MAGGENNYNGIMKKADKNFIDLRFCPLYKKLDKYVYSGSCYPVKYKSKKGVLQLP